MFLTILITFISLISLIVLHELGHFILAKKFGVKVEEFGIGYPPRIFGKKVGETIYSINLLPLGAFVKIYGEEERLDDPRSFNKKPIWQRTSIILGGVASFWIISAILISLVAGVWGLPISVRDEENYKLREPRVQITAIAQDSPAEKAGLKIGDIIKQLELKDEQLIIDKTKTVIDFTENHKGEEITLVIERGGKRLNVSLIPRISPPKNEGPMGIGLTRVALKSYRWYEVPTQGISVTGKMTISIISALGDIISRIIHRTPLPPGMIEFKGVVGIGEMAAQTLERGVSEYLLFFAMISTYLALFNILPIPALDGGKLLFLGIEKLKGKPVNSKIEQNITAVFFALLIVLAIWVTIKDIAKLF